MNLSKAIWPIRTQIALLIVWLVKTVCCVVKVGLNNIQSFNSFLATYVYNLCNCVPPQMTEIKKNGKPCSLYEHIIRLSQIGFIVYVSTSWKSPNLSCLKPAYLSFANDRYTICQCKNQCKRLSYKVQDIQYGYHWLETDRVQLSNKLFFNSNFSHYETRISYRFKFNWTTFKSRFNMFRNILFLGFCPMLAEALASSSAFWSPQ